MWTRIEQRIDLLALVGREQEIRQFACWVARQTDLHPKRGHFLTLETAYK